MKHKQNSKLTPGNKNWGTINLRKRKQGQIKSGQLSGADEEYIVYLKDSHQNFGNFSE